MIAVYIVFGIFAFILLYIFVLYTINSIKLRKKKAKTEPKKEKVEVDKKATEASVDTGIKNKKTDIETIFLDESPKEMAMKKAFEESKQKELQSVALNQSEPAKHFYEDEEMTELERELSALGKGRRYAGRSMLNKHMSSETNVIGVEGPTNTENEIAKTETKQNNVGIDVANLSDDAKKILIADILNKKY